MQTKYSLEMSRILTAEQTELFVRNVTGIDCSHAIGSPLHTPSVSFTSSDLFRNSYNSSYQNEFIYMSHQKSWCHTTVLMMKGREKWEWDSAKSSKFLIVSNGKQMPVSLFRDITNLYVRQLCFVFVCFPHKKGLLCIAIFWNYGWVYTIAFNSSGYS